jgi:hypothetical protein
MKIECVDNTGESISENLFSLYGYSKEMVFLDITIGNIYIVYAIFTMKGEKWYLICTDSYNGIGWNFPSFLPASLFKVIDDSISKYWISAYREDRYSESKELVLNTGFPNIVNEDGFLSNLLEDGEREINLFKKYKHLIDSESAEKNDTFWRKFRNLCRDLKQGAWAKIRLAQNLRQRK